MTKEFNRVATGALIAAAVGIFVSVGPIIASTFGIFMATFDETFGISRSAFSSVILLTTLVGAVGTPITGRAIDKYGVRRVILPGVFLFGLAMMGGALVQGELWQLYLAYGVIGIFAGVQNTVAYSKLISLWFQRNRGKVLAIISMAAGISYGIMPHITRATIAAEGWQSAYLLLGGLVIASLVVLIPLLRVPEGTAPGAAVQQRNNAEGNTPAQAMRTGVFWTLCVLLFLAVMSFVGTTAHVFPMMLDRGLDGTSAATVLSVFAMGTIGGQLSYGFLLDRFATPKIAMPFFLLGLIGMTMLHRAVDLETLMLGSVLMGIGQGSELGLAAYLVSRYFGTRNFGEIYGYVFAAATVASGIGPLLFGMSFDILGGYGAIMLATEISVALVVMGTLLLPSYRYLGERKMVATPAQEEPQTA